VLRSLMTNGGWFDIDITGKTDTKAGWAEILTGYGPDITGVYSNMKFQPIPRGYTIFERLEAHYGDDSFMTAAFIGKDHHVGGYAAEIKRPLTRRELTFVDSRRRLRADHDILPDSGKATDRQLEKSLARGRVITENGRRYLYSPAEPYFYAWQGVDVWKKALHRNESVGVAALAWLKANGNQPFFLFVHFADIDSQGHLFGENSKQYNDALISCDKWTGRILAELSALGLSDTTQVYVTADHGFDEGEKNHARAPSVFLVTNDPAVKRGGRRTDIAPTIYRRLGIDGESFSPPLTGHPLQ